MRKSGLAEKYVRIVHDMYDDSTYEYNSVKGSFLYSAVSGPLDRSTRCTLFALPGRPVHSDTNLASPGNFLETQQLHATTKSLAFPPLSIGTHLYSRVNWGVNGENENAQSYLPNGTKGGFEPSILPLS